MKNALAVRYRLMRRTVSGVNFERSSSQHERTKSTAQHLCRAAQTARRFGHGRSRTDRERAHGRDRRSTEHTAETQAQSSGQTDGGGGVECSGVEDRLHPERTP